jgi:hypothetical protein
MPRSDPRYKYVNSVWTAGELNSFAEIFNIVPKSVVSKDLGINYGRFAKRVQHPGSLTFDEALHLAKLLQIAPQSLANLIMDNLEEPEIDEAE